MIVNRYTCNLIVLQKQSSRARGIASRIPSAFPPVATAPTRVESPHLCHCEPPPSSLLQHCPHSVPQLAKRAVPSGGRTLGTTHFAFKVMLATQGKAAEQHDGRCSSGVAG